MLSEIPIWRIKYMPKSLNEICGRDSTINRLSVAINQRNFPHLLFVGEEGIGKTTIANLFSKEFLGNFFDANSKLVYSKVPLTEEERKEALMQAEAKREPDHRDDWSRHMKWAIEEKLHHFIRKGRWSCVPVLVLQICRSMNHMRNIAAAKEARTRQHDLAKQNKDPYLPKKKRR